MNLAFSVEVLFAAVQLTGQLTWIDHSIMQITDKSFFVISAYYIHGTMTADP